MDIYLLDDTLKVNVYYDPSDCGFDDNICFSFLEECPEEEKILRASETNLYLTCDQARQIALALLQAVGDSESGSF